VFLTSSILYVSGVTSARQNPGHIDCNFSNSRKLAQLIRQIQILRKGELERQGRSIPYVNLALHGARALLGAARGARAAEQREVLGDLHLG
jgi:hypothetical protein